MQVAQVFLRQAKARPARAGPALGDHDQAGRLLPPQDRGSGQRQATRPRRPAGPQEANNRLLRIRASPLAMVSSVYPVLLCCVETSVATERALPLRLRRVRQRISSLLVMPRPGVRTPALDAPPRRPLPTPHRLDLQLCDPEAPAVESVERDHPAIGVCCRCGPVLCKSCCVATAILLVPIDSVSVVCASQGQAVVPLAAR